MRRAGNLPTGLWQSGLWCGLVAGLLLAGTGWGQTPSPKYRSYVQFAADDAADRIAIKKSYNEAVQRYNQAQYEYLVTLERVNRLVELYNTAIDPAIKRRAREDAEPLRGRLTELEGTVRRLASALDEAGRAAASRNVAVPLD